MLASTALGIGTLAVGALGVGGGLVSGIQDYFQGQKNYELSKDQNAWQRDMVLQGWAREDNATQRRVADLEAAGLSPVLAAGSPASSAMAPQIKAAETNIPMDAGLKAFQGALMAGNLMQMKKNIAETQASIDLKNAQTAVTQQSVGINQSKLAIQQKLADADISLKDVQLAFKNHDFAIFDKLGITTNSSGDIKQIIDAIALLTKQGKTVIDKAKSPVTQNAVREFSAKVKEDGPKVQQKWDHFDRAIISRFPKWIQDLY